MPTFKPRLTDLVMLPWEEAFMLMCDYMPSLPLEFHHLPWDLTTEETIASLLHHFFYYEHYSQESIAVVARRLVATLEPAAVITSEDLA